MCGPADQGYHLGISLKGKGWHCWRNQAHKGRSRVRLIQLLLKCDLDTAKSLAGVAAIDLVEDVSVGEQLRSQLVEDHNSEPERSLKLLREFKHLITKSVLATPFYEYLAQRGYRARQIEWLADIYDLHYAVRGPYAYRVIVPIYDRYDKMLSWTGRTILKDGDPRYLSLSTHANRRLPAAKCPTAATLLGLHYLWTCSNPRVLVICEGPFDALWVSTFGHSLGVHATCLFGLNISEAQAVLLDELSQRFERMVLLLDSAASLQAFRLAQSGLDLEIMRLPEGAKDPGDLSTVDVTKLCVGLVGS